jgi:hypothetical protein
MSRESIGTSVRFAHACTIEQGIQLNADIYVQVLATKNLAGTLDAIITN